MQEQIKISLVIPTRERAETLKHTIQTALNQKLEAYEVIISDNFSQDNTKAIVDSFNDNRLKYVNTKKRLAMTDNFNFGVSHANGEYIIVIGDDDGVMPNAMDRLAEFIVDHPSKLYVWPRHGYIWPANNNQARMERFADTGELTKINLTEQLIATLRKGLCLNSRMPNTYHSATHRDIYAEIKLKTGVYYDTTIPDEYMLFTLPIYADFTINTGIPLTANGHSVKSNSGTVFNIEKKTDSNEPKELDKFIKEYGVYQLHSSIPHGLPSTASFVMDTFLRVRDLYPNYYKNFRINYSGLWAYAWQIFFLKNVFEPVKRRKEFQNKESFSAITYLVYSVLFFTFLNVIRKLLIKSKQEKHARTLFEKNPPQNINEFVNFVHNQSITNCAKSHGITKRS